MTTPTQDLAADVDQRPEIRHIGGGEFRGPDDRPLEDGDMPDMLASVRCAVFEELAGDHEQCDVLAWER